MRTDTALAPREVTNCVPDSGAATAEATVRRARLRLTTRWGNSELGSDSSHGLPTGGTSLKLDSHRSRELAESACGDRIGKRVRDELGRIGRRIPACNDLAGDMKCWLQTGFGRDAQQDRDFVGREPAVESKRHGGHGLGFDHSLIGRLEQKQCVAQLRPIDPNG